MESGCSSLMEKVVVSDERASEEELTKEQNSTVTDADRKSVGPPGPPSGPTLGGPSLSC